MNYPKFAATEFIRFRYAILAADIDSLEAELRQRLRQQRAELSNCERTDLASGRSNRHERQQPIDRSVQNKTLLS